MLSADRGQRRSRPSSPSPLGRAPPSDRDRLLDRDPRSDRAPRPDSSSAIRSQVPLDRTPKRAGTSDRSNNRPPVRARGAERPLSPLGPSPASKPRKPTSISGESRELPMQALRADRPPGLSPAPSRTSTPPPTLQHSPAVAEAADANEVKDRIGISESRPAAESEKRANGHTDDVVHAESGIPPSGGSSPGTPLYLYLCGNQYCAASCPMITKHIYAKPRQLCGLHI